MSEDVVRDVGAEASGVDAGPHSPAPSKYPWRVHLTESFAHTLFYETEAKARATYHTVQQIIIAAGEYKDDIPRSIILTDDVGERTFSTVGIRSVAVIHADPLDAEADARAVANAVRAGIIISRRVLPGDGVGQGPTYTLDPEATTS